MMSSWKDLRLTRIGVFYDGNYFWHVSNYYNYNHSRRSRISIGGLHEFVRHEVAKQEDIDVGLCQIVDAHYFRGRLSADDAKSKNNQLYYERLFDDILMSEGVITHYLPLKKFDGQIQEKGIDVWLALEAFELAFYKRFNVVVLIACDGDYVPLIRKLNTLGTRVMVLSWDFKYTNEYQQEITTRTSQDLLEEVTYPVMMHEIIDNRVRKSEPLINNLFVSPSNSNTLNSSKQPGFTVRKDEVKTSEILSLKSGFGFIKYPPNNLFFHFSSLLNADFNELAEGDTVEFTIGKNDKNEPIAINVKKLVDL